MPFSVVLPGGQVASPHFTALPPADRARAEVSAMELESLIQNVYTNIRDDYRAAEELTDKVSSAIDEYLGSSNLAKLSIGEKPL